MTLNEIREHLERCAREQPMLPSEHFKFDRYHDNPRYDGEVSLVTDPRYLPPLASLIATLKPSRMLTIGALFGTLESYVLQCCGGRSWSDSITICDLDIPAYNANRDNGSLIYRNICGTQYGAYQRMFTHIFGSSMWPDVMHRIRACGPYDLIFIDGEHTHRAVYSDLDLAAETLAEDGTILVHDTSLHSSGVPAGWTAWANANNEHWRCHAVTDDVFLLGLGFAQRAPALTEG